MAESRSASISRKTNETSVSVSVTIDGTGTSKISTGVGFFDHMLDQLSRHSLIDMDIDVTGDLHIDDHHTVEDTGIAIGQAISKALGDRRGIVRYASIDLAMDETMTKAAIDVSGRPFLVWNVAFSAPKIGTFDTELVREFFRRWRRMLALPCISSIIMARITIISPKPASRPSPAPCAARLKLTPPGGPHSVHQGNAVNDQV